MKDSMSGRTPAPDPLPQPTIDEQRPGDVSVQLNSLLELLWLLKKQHHPRPAQLYNLVVRQCLAEKRPDEAAKVYFSLVEDWIMEGRVAEGANPEDFGRGGVPSQELIASTKGDKSLFDVWFGTVRTWRLPGEALSLHDRLDLWHPQHAAPSKRLRGFPLPIPTSPPTQVPQPTIDLLIPIISRLRLDPHTATPVEYATSMRALAILANTILSRSLPIPAIPGLLKAFSNSHTHPAVYPAEYDSPPEEDAWAYTANTQVHVALVSLMFSPPNYARAMDIQSSLADGELPSPQGAARYSLHPLGWQACLVLISYAATKLRQPRFVRRVLDYMKETFIGWTPTVYNALFRSATLSRDNKLAREIDNTLFGDSILGKGVFAGQQVRLPPGARSEASEALDDTLSIIPHVPNTPSPDQYSLTALLSHLIATSQYERFHNVVHTLIPFLAVNTTTPMDVIKRIAEATGADIGYRGRLTPSELTPRLYTIIVNGLVKAGNTGLAQRVYHLAESIEKRYLEKIIDVSLEQAGVAQPVVSSGTADDVPRTPDDDLAAAVVDLHELASVRMPIHLYTSMMYLWGNEGRKSNSSLRVGWVVPSEFKYLARAEAGKAMARDLYRHVSRRWKHLRRDERFILHDILPDERFFNSVTRALGSDWNLDNDQPLSPQMRTELSNILHDTAQLGIPPPPGLVAKLHSPYIVNGAVMHSTRKHSAPDTSVLPKKFLSSNDAMRRFIEYDRQRAWSTTNALPRDFGLRKAVDTDYSHFSIHPQDQDQDPHPHSIEHDSPRIA